MNCLVFSTHHYVSIWWRWRLTDWLFTRCSNVLAVLHKSPLKTKTLSHILYLSKPVNSKCITVCYQRNIPVFFSSVVLKRLETSAKSPVCHNRVLLVSAQRLCDLNWCHVRLVSWNILFTRSWDRKSKNEAEHWFLPYLYAYVFLLACVTWWCLCQCVCLFHEE